MESAFLAADQCNLLAFFGTIAVGVGVLWVRLDFVNRPFAANAEGCTLTGIDASVRGCLDSVGESVVVTGLLP